MDKKKELRVAVEEDNGHIVYLPQSEVEAFTAGQEARRRGERPKDAERRASELLSMLKGSKK